MKIEKTIILKVTRRCRRFCFLFLEKIQLVKSRAAEGEHIEDEDDDEKQTINLYLFLIFNF